MLKNNIVHDPISNIPPIGVIGPKKDIDNSIAL